MTETISVADLRESAIAEVTIGLIDPALRLKTQRTVTVTLPILPGPVERTVRNRPVHLRNLGAHLSAQAMPVVVDVGLRGSREALSGIDADAVTAFIDVVGLGPGNYMLGVHADAGSGRRDAYRSSHGRGPNHQCQRLNDPPAPRLFGTDGVRGAAGQYPLDAPTVRRLGAALVRALPRGSDFSPPRLLVGRDTRESGGWIEAELACGASGERAVVTSAGVVPTPAIAYLTRSVGYDAGIVISASHNPFADNGIKVFSGKGEKFTESVEREVEEIVADAVVDRGGRAGASRRPRAARSMPISIICAPCSRRRPIAPRFQARRRLRQWRHDRSPRPSSSRAWASTPSSSRISPTAATSTAIADRRIPKRLRAPSSNAAATWAWRSMATATARSSWTTAATSINGDAVLLMCARQLQREGRLRGNAIVATVMSNIGLEIACRESGISLVRCPVGDKYVMEEMLKGDVSLGGEQSGHVIFSDYLYTGDGLCTALNVLRTIARTGRTLASLASDLTNYPQVLLNVRVREKVDLQSVPAVAAAIAAVETRVSGDGGQGRLLSATRAPNRCCA